MTPLIYARRTTVLPRDAVESLLARTPMSKINEKRTRSFQRKSVAELKKFVDAKTLSSAAAAYELRRRGAGAGAVSDEEETDQ